MKTKTTPQLIKDFMAQNPFNALFIYEALNRYSAYVMTLDPKDYETSVVSLNLVQEIAQDWNNFDAYKPIKAKIGDAEKI